MLDFLARFVHETWLLVTEMGGWLLLGFAVAGLLSVFISPAWLERHLGGRGPGPILKAALFGVPLPLCSCGVIPVAASLRQHGASRGATTAFLLSTPQTGVDSILVTYSMLGPLFAIFRPVAALATGLLGGTLVEAGSDGARAPAPASPGVSATAAAPDDRPRGTAARLRAAWAYGTVTLPGDIGRALLWGILIAGLIATAVPADFLGTYLGAGPVSIALMMVVGIPIYVCATASVPLAAGFIALGASPGAALAFLIAGPATNAATVTTISRVLGRRTTVIYLATVACSAFGGGLLLDWLMPRVADTIPVLTGVGHDHDGASWLDHFWGAGLVVVMTWSWWRSRHQPSCCDESCSTGENAAMTDRPLATRAFKVEGMHCSHCQGSVDRALRELPFVTDCRVDLEEGRAVVEGNAIDQEAVVAAIDGLGFKARPDA